jgi:hypothetical protein
MATTLTVQNTINYAQAYNQWRSLNIGTANEPAITIANLLLQTIISPPFSWNWNRSSVSFLTTIGQQDYVTLAATFGFIEKASWVPACSITTALATGTTAVYTSATPLGPAFVIGALVTIVGCTSNFFNLVQVPILSVTSNTFTVALVHAAFGPETETTAVATNGSKTEISQVLNVLGDGNELGAPSNIAPQIDDNAGNITFRLLPLPSQVYQITVIFQKRIPSLITTLSNTWAPIPDHYSVLYDWGFTAMMLAYSGNPMWQQFNSKFVAALLGMAEGLSEDQKNIFQTAWLASITEQSLMGMKAQQGTAGRGT